MEYILRNPVYIGKLRWNPTGRTRRDFFNENLIVADSDHEPLVTMEMWDAAQQRLDEVKAQWGYKARPSSELKHWLSGLVRCSSCGATLIFSAPHYYKCNNYVRGRCASSQHIKAETLANALIEQLTVDSEKSNNLVYNVTYSNQSGGDDLARMEAALKQLQTKKSRLQDAYLSGVLELDDFAATKKVLENSIQQTEQEIEDFRKRSDETVVVAAIQTAIRAALNTLTDPSATIEQKNNAARSVIVTCTFDKQTYTLSVTYGIIL